MFLTLRMMSEESTVSTSQGLINVADVSHIFHTLNSQNENGVSGHSERSKFYITQETFSIEQQVAFRKMKKKDVVCGHIGRQDKTMAVELLTWCQRMVQQ